MKTFYTTDIGCDFAELGRMMKKYATMPYAFVAEKGVYTFYDVITIDGRPAYLSDYIRWADTPGNDQPVEPSVIFEALQKRHAEDNDGNAGDSVEYSCGLKYVVGGRGRVYWYCLSESGTYVKVSVKDVEIALKSCNTNLDSMYSGSFEGYYFRCAGTGQPIIIHPRA